jgi:CheY-like chemotaxis protein
MKPKNGLTLECADDPPAGTRPRILALNDDHDFLDALDELLSAEGYDVVTTTSAEEALTRACHWRPSLLITDLNMDVCDGVEFILRLTERGILAGVPKVILSSAATEVVRQRMRQSGVDAEVFDKNGRIDVLLEAVARLARRPHPG